MKEFFFLYVFFVQTNHTRKELLFLMFKEINLRNHSSLHKLFYSLPYSIAVGIPARVIKYRFNEEIILELLKIDFSSITKETVQKNINLFERPVNMDTVKKIQRLQNK